MTKKKIDNSSKTSYLSLFSLGILAAVIGIGVVLDGLLVYGHPWFHSISDSATTGLETGMLLPFGLGGLAFFMLGYTGYDKVDNILAKLMAFGFFLVAMQPCSAGGSGLMKIGAFGLTPAWSSHIHSIGALLGFGVMAYWVSIQFRKGVLDDDQTTMKKWRNRIYATVGWTMLSALIVVALGKIFDWSTTIFWAEECLLLPASVAILVKSGAFLKDK
jgi:hypothetical protein